MLLGKRRMKLEDDDEEPVVTKRVQVSDMNNGFNDIHVKKDITTAYSTFGPIPIAWFDASLFPSTAMVTVYVPQNVVGQVLNTALTQQCSSSVPLPLSLDMPVVEPELQVDAQGAVAARAATQEATLLHGAIKPVDNGTTTPNSTITTTTPLAKPRVVFGKKSDVKHIINLLDVASYSDAKLAFSTRMFLESIPESMVTKRRNMGLLLNNCQNWHGVGVLTLEKDERHRGVTSKIFTENLTNISQYVRPLGFAAGECVLPSNAICYTSYNKGNHQVTYILTDVLRYADVVRYNNNNLASSKKRRKNVKEADGGVKGSSTSVKRFSYGMTVLKNWTRPIEVQFSLMTLLSLAFFLLRKWCRQNAVFHALIDPSFAEPSFEALSECIIQESYLALNVPFTEKEIHLLLKRANCLFKKLIQLFLTLYPDVSTTNFHETTLL